MSGAADKSSGDVHLSMSQDKLVKDKEKEISMGGAHTKLFNLEQGLEDELEIHKGVASSFSCIFNLSNTILGAGILSIPHAFNLAGFYLGVFLLCLFALGANYGLKLLAECARWTKASHTSYFVVALHTFPWAAYVIDAAVAIKCFGVACSYLIIIGSSMRIPIKYWTDAQDGDPLADRRLYIGCLAILCVPLALAKTLDRLKYVSFFSVMVIIYLSVCTVSYFAYNVNDAPTGPDGFQGTNWSIDIIEALPILVFAYTCHQNVFTVYNELKSNTKSRVFRVIDISIVAALALYLLNGITAYFTFFQTVDSNMLETFPADNEFINVCRLLIGFHGALTYPLQIHPARHSIDNLLFGHLKKRANMMNESGTVLGEAGEKKSRIEDPGAWLEKTANLRHYCESIFLLVATFAVALTVDDLGFVFGIVGSTGSTSLCYLIPGMFYLKRCSLAGDKRFTLRKAIAALMVLFGIFMLIAGNYVVINSYFNK
eukprot:Nk52_evm10s179 gene=Nk52_evmTU10s179